MSAIGPFAIPILAVGAFVASLGWFGYQHVTRPASAPQQVGKGQNAAAEPARPPAEPSAPDAGRSAEKPESGKPSQAQRGAPAVNGAAGASSEPAVVAPAFDVVRVEPTGEAVIAGRAPPGSSVELVANGVRHSRVVADPSGLFAIVPEALPPGSHELVLQATNGDGSLSRSQQSVTVVVASNRKDTPLVTITAPGQPTVVLSRPDSVPGAGGGRQVSEADRPATGDAAKPPANGEGVKSATEAAKPRRTVQIASVETEGAGRLLVSGSAAPAAVIRLYLNETFIAPASAGPDGRVSFAIERGMQPGAYKVRLDDVDPVSGQVRSRAEVPFDMPGQVASAPASGSEEGGASRDPATRSGEVAAGGGGTPAGTAPPTVVVPEITTTVVSRGDSLWTISKRAYGQGLRYSIIYGANAKQIRDPDLIYPGQLFVLPANSAEAATR